MFWNLYNKLYRKVFGQRFLAEVLDADGHFICYTWGREY